MENIFLNENENNPIDHRVLVNKMSSIKMVNLIYCHIVVVCMTVSSEAAFNIAEQPVWR